MSYGDFVKHFTSTYATKVADDQWNRFWVRAMSMSLAASDSQARKAGRDALIHVVLSS